MNFFSFQSLMSANSARCFPRLRSLGNTDYQIVYLNSSLSFFFRLGKCLVAHNILRALHQNTGPLAWDANLATGAQKWAVYLAKNNRFEHANTRYGENLYSQWGGNSGNDPNSCAKAVHSWYV